MAKLTHVAMEYTEKFVYSMSRRLNQCHQWIEIPWRENDDNFINAASRPNNFANSLFILNQITPVILYCKLPRLKEKSVVSVLKFVINYFI